MKLLRTAVEYIAVRPFILWFPAAFALVLCIADIYNPLSSILIGLSTVTGDNITESIVSLLQIVLDPAFIPLAAAISAILIIVVSILGGLLLSGYFNILYNASVGTSLKRGEFFTGVGKYFLKLTGINFIVLLSGAILTGFLMVSIVPSVVASRAVNSGRLEFSVSALFIEGLTAVVILFILIFYRAYMFFWYPAVFNQMRKPFSMVRKMVDKTFWSITGRFLLFDMFAAASIWFLMQKSGSPLMFVFDWLFKTVYFVLFVVFIFGRFNIYRNITENKKPGT